MKNALLILFVIVSVTVHAQTAGKLYRENGVLKTDVRVTTPTGIIIVIPGVPITDSTDVVVNPPTPEPPQPPSNIVNVAPGSGTIGRALAEVKPGVTLKLAAGVYIERYLIIPAEVNIEGIIGQSILKPDPSAFNSSRGNNLAYMLINGGGNQSFKNFTIDGDGKKLYGGIGVNKPGVVIDGVTVQNCGFTGIWLWPAKDIKLLNATIINSAWGDNAADRANLMISDCDNVEISNLTIQTNSNYGIKFYPGTNNGGAIYIKNVKIHDSRISTPAKGTWNGGTAPAFVLEIWANSFEGVDIYNNQFNNGFSVVNTITVAEDKTKAMKVHDNTFDLAAAGGYNEFSASNVEFYYNYVNGGTNAFKSTGKQVNYWHLHHNVFYNVNGGAYPTGVISIEKGPVPSRNIVITNNTVEQSNSSTAALFAIGGNQSGMRAESLTLKDNLFINNTAQGQWGQNKFIDLRNGATFTGTFTSNWGQNVNATNCTSCYSGDPRINKTGTKVRPFYAPEAGSPIINKGSDGKTIGAIQQ